MRSLCIGVDIHEAVNNIQVLCCQGFAKMGFLYTGVELRKIFRPAVNNINIHVNCPILLFDFKLGFSGHIFIKVSKYQILQNCSQ